MLRIEERVEKIEEGQEDMSKKLDNNPVLQKVGAI